MPRVTCSGLAWHITHHLNRGWVRTPIRWRCRESNPGPKNSGTDIYKHSQPISVSSEAPGPTRSLTDQPTGSWSPLSASRGCMPVFLTPGRRLTGQQPPGARPLARDQAQASLMRRGGEPRSWCSWHLTMLLWFNEERAPRLAVHDQPSPSKPVIPKSTHYTRIALPAEEDVRGCRRTHGTRFWATGPRAGGGGPAVPPSGPHWNASFGPTFSLGRYRVAQHADSLYLHRHHIAGRQRSNPGRCPSQDHVTRLQGHDAGNV